VNPKPNGTALIEPTADVDPRATIGTGTRVWHLAQIREGARVGSDCVIGRGAYIGPGVRVGDRSKIQNFALVYEPAVLSDGVFVGPAVVMTNDRHPRAINADDTSKGPTDWEPVGVTVLHGAALGARCVCVAPVTIGRWAMVAAGATVVADVPDYALVAGTPARRIGWVGQAGVPLVQVGDAVWRCPRTGGLFEQRSEHELVAT
jgi:acetyltransferase-like isoleucine patch superfamily enzyme